MRIGDDNNHQIGDISKLCLARFDLTVHGRDTATGWPQKSRTESSNVYGAMPNGSKGATIPTQTIEMTTAVS